MDYELPTEFDIVVVGTGIVESIVSAAASRIGKSVLHIDTDEFYGGQSASFSLEAIATLPVHTNTSTEYAKDITVSDGEKLLPIGNNLFDIQDVTNEWHIEASTPPAKTEDQQPENEITESGDAIPEFQKLSTDVEKSKEVEPIIWTKDKLLKESRKFNIDLAPKFNFARGDFVELLISSNIARYSEFRSVSRVLTWLNDQLEVVPCSRSDVFSNDKVSVVEKRMLMKLITACVEGDDKEFQGCEAKTFKTFLKDRKLTDNLVHYVLYSIAMCNEDTSCLEGIERTKRFLQSLGRFGKTPFLYSMYGSGEIPQAFCRLSAVFGATYALNQNIGGVIVDKDNKFEAVACGKQSIKAKHLVVGLEKAPRDFIASHGKSYVSRAVFVTDKSIMESEKEHLTLLLMPPEDGKPSVTVLEMGTLTGTCPKGLHLVHMFTKKTAGPKEDFKHCVEKLFSLSGENKPKILWSLYYSMPDANIPTFQAKVTNNIFVCPGPDIDLDFDVSVKQAEKIFKEIYPNEDFLPRAPDPEEIIIGEEDESKTDEKGGSLDKVDLTAEDTQDGQAIPKED